MRSVRLAGGLEVSPLGVGAWAWGDRLFWGYDDSQEDGAQQAFNTAVDLGVNLFDTAEVVYGTVADPNILTSQSPVLNPLYSHCILTFENVETCRFTAQAPTPTAGATGTQVLTSQYI